MAAKSKRLRIPDEGCCAGHPCDGCEECLAGRCCGSDVGEAGLPLEGSWPGPWHGKVGVLAERKDGKLRCHCCGEWWANLGRHVFAHGLTADAYRAMWGLRARRALASETLRRQRAALGAEHGHRLTEAQWKRPTPEQRSKWARGREARAETRLARDERVRDPHGRWVPATPGRFVARLAPSADLEHD